MPSSFVPADSVAALTAQLQAERRLRERAEAEVSGLKKQLVETQLNAQRYSTRLSALVQNLRMGLLLVDDSGQVELVNQRFLELFGLEDQAAGLPRAMGLSVAARMQHHFPDPAAHLARAAAIRQAGRTVLNEELVLVDGRVLERDYLVLDNAMAGRLVCYRDVTSRHAREAQLHTASLISEQSPNPILRLTTAGQLLYANPAARPVVQQLEDPAGAALQRQLLQLVTTALRTAAPQQQEIGVGARYFLLTAAPVPAAGYATLYLVDITARRQVEQQFAEQREFYETILEELPVAISVFDAQHRYLFVNPSVITDEPTREWMIGQTNFAVCAYRGRPLALAQQRQAMFEQAVRARQDVRWEETIATGPGSIHMLRRFRPLFHPDGTLRMVVAYGVDTTEQHRAELQLAEQREFYETILNNLSADISVLDARHRYLFVNPVSVKNPEIRAWLIGKDDFEYCAYRQRPVALARQRRQMFEQAVQQREEIQWEETLESAAGPRRVLRRLAPIFGPDASLRLVVSLGLDITDRYLAEERQRQSEAEVQAQQEFIRQIVDTSPNFLYVADKNGTPIFTNASFELLLQGSRHAQLGPDDDDTPEAAEVRQLNEWHARVMATGQELSTEMPFTLADGQVRQLQVVKRPLVRPHGTLEVLTVCTDITELKRAKREAEAAARARENFLANMSHEIRTPMNGVLGMAGLLARTQLSARQQEFVTIIRNSGTHLLGVLNDVLDVAKITSGKLELEHIAFDLNQVLHRLGQTLTFQAAGKGLGFRLELLPLDQPIVLSDPQRLQQVLLNLLSNSLKFTEKGHIVLAGTLLRETPTSLTIGFRVSDTGMGVTPDKQETIFSTFSQAYADTTRRFGGTGLGLSISSSLVEQLGGHLVLCSVPDQGSSFGFTLTFPKAAAAAAIPPAQPPADADAVRGRRVLLVEDHDVNRQLAQLVLESYAVQVDTAADGATALALFEQHPYDLVLMDIQMPGMSGLEATAHIRRCPDPARARTPIIALTANAFRADNERYLAAGLDDCLAKPFEAAELLSRMVALLAPVAPLFDLAGLHRMAHGSPDFVPRILTSFLTHTPALIEELAEAAATAQWPRAAGAAHKLKPSLKLLQVSRVLPALATLEDEQAPEAARQRAAQLLLLTLPDLLTQLAAGLRPD
ncbi:PAS domain-containing protein [Hymenobacter algoricola]|uniref:histidine kinase n=1 Tax=Hymenobacter algoricola TaxID=486267 RepID=A0ABP7NBM8_9BACT